MDLSWLDDVFIFMDFFPKGIQSLQAILDENNYSNI